MKTIQDQIDDPEGLRKYIVPWSIYINGARDMALKMRQHLLIDEAGNPKSDRNDKVANKAVVDLILSSKENTERFLMEEYEIRLTDHEKDKKGKLVKCRAYFAKKVIQYKEIPT